MNSRLAEALERMPLVAILRGIRPAEAAATGEVLVAAGFSIIEVPLNSPSPTESIGILARRFRDVALIGAGTVRTHDDVKAVADAGGELIVMPHADTRIIAAAHARGLAVIPGFATPTEAFAALDAGADALKLFPAEAAPPAVLKAMKAVLPPGVPVLPVGSIRPESMAAYLKAGAAGFGLGGALYQPGMSLADLERNARAFTDALAACRGA